MRNKKGEGGQARPSEASWREKEKQEEEEEEEEEEGDWV